MGHREAAALLALGWAYVPPGQETWIIGTPREGLMFWEVATPEEVAVFTSMLASEPELAVVHRTTVSARAEMFEAARASAA